jgi:hypothetical protein
LNSAAAGLLTIAYGLYSKAVDVYAERKVRAMQKIPLFIIPNNEDVATPARLLRSISKRSNLVENPADRRAWNAWMMMTTDAKPNFVPGTYSYAYRSYVNFEEKDAIGRALLAWHIFGIASAENGRIILHEDGTRVTMVEHYRMRLVKPIKITWNGTLRTSKHGRKRIVWTDTEMKIGKKVVQNPEASEKLRQIPWDVVKDEEGLVVFKRGDVGMLAYHKEN